MLTVLAIAGYRSLRNLVVPLGRLNLITGPNGSGKSSLYRALRLLADASQGRVIPSLAQEGGLSRTLWAGPELVSRHVKRLERPVQAMKRIKPVALQMGFASTEFGYAIDLGLPQPSESMFGRDPEIKRECVWHGPKLRPSALTADRRGGMFRVRSDSGEWSIIATNLATYDSIFTQMADPLRAPELMALRERMRGWRFYDHVRTDAESPARRPQIGTRTMVMSGDGHDVAAAIQTILEIGNREAFDRAVEDAFPRSRVRVIDAGGFVVQMEQHGLLRALDVSELSDGTLRYLTWIAVLLTPRPPELMVLNEPETSLHPDLLPALGRLIRKASEESQVIVVSHAKGLVEELRSGAGCKAIELEKDMGETRVKGGEGQPEWEWPVR